MRDVRSNCYEEPIMNVRHLFGKPLPHFLRPKSSPLTSSWIATLSLFAIAGLTVWAVKSLLTKDARETEEMIYFWPE